MKNKLLEEIRIDRCVGDKAVTIIHFPTGIVVECNDYPTFEENKQSALKNLEKEIMLYALGPPS